MAKLGNFLSSIGKSFMGDPFGSLASIAGVLNSVMQIGVSAREEKKQKRLMDYEDQIADKNYEKQLQDQRQLIAEDREYNSIGQQMRRAREGGVSGLAALGVSSGNSIGASAPSQSAPSPTSGLKDSATAFGGALMSSLQGLQQMKLQQEQAKMLREQQATERVDRAKKEFETEIAQMEKEGWSELREKRLRELDSIITRNMSDAGYTNELAETEKATRQEKINNLVASTNNLNTGTALNVAKTITENVMRDVTKRLANENVRLTQAKFYESLKHSDLLANQASHEIEKQALTEETKSKVTAEIKKVEDEIKKIKAEILAIESNTSLDETRKNQMIADCVFRYGMTAKNASDIFDTWLGDKGEKESETSKDLKEGAKLGKKLLLEYGLSQMK